MEDDGAAARDAARECLASACGVDVTDLPVSAAQWDGVRGQTRAQVQRLWSDGERAAWRAALRDVLANLTPQRFFFVAMADGAVVGVYARQDAAAAASARGIAAAIGPIGVSFVANSTM